MGVSNVGIDIFIPQISPVITKVKVGTGTTAFNSADTDLEIPFPINQRNNIVDDMESLTGWSAVDGTISLNTTILKEGSNSINLNKTGVADTTVNLSKTTTSRDFTNKEFYCWIYVSNAVRTTLAATGINIRFGSDLSNYYQYDVLTSTLVDGWNNVNFSVSDTTTTGSPVITASDYTEFIINTQNNTDTWTDGNLIIDFLRLIAPEDYFTAIDTTLEDLVNDEITKTFVLNSIQANGIGITEVGFFNSANQLIVREVFTAQSKSDTEEFRFTNITEILNT